MGVHMSMRNCMRGYSIPSQMHTECCTDFASYSIVQQYLLMCAHILPYACSMAMNSQKKYHPSLCQAPKQHQPWQCQSAGCSSWRSSTGLRQAPAARHHPCQHQAALLHLGMQWCPGCLTRTRLCLVRRPCLVGHRPRFFGPQHSEADRTKECLPHASMSVHQCCPMLQ